MPPLRILQAIIQIHAPRLTRIVEARVILGQIVDALEIAIFQLTLERGEILRDPVGVNTLGNHARAPSQTPLQRHLGGRAVALRGNGSQNLVLEELRRLTFVVSRVRAGEGRVGRDVDAAILVPRDPVALRQVGVQFHLVHGGRVARVVEQVLELVGREVRYADVSGFAFADEFGHRGPGF